MRAHLWIAAAAAASPAAMATTAFVAVRAAYIHMLQTQDSCVRTRSMHRGTVQRLARLRGRVLAARRCVLAVRSRPAPAAAAAPAG